MMKMVLEQARLLTVLQHTLIQKTVWFCHKQTEQTLCIFSMILMVLLSDSFGMAHSICIWLTKWAMLSVLRITKATSLFSTSMTLGVLKSVAILPPLQLLTHSVTVVIITTMKQGITICKADIMIPKFAGLLMQIMLMLLKILKIFIMERTYIFTV